MTEPVAEAPPGPPANRPRAGAETGIFHFSIERRAAPALFVAGWLATIVGVAGLIVGVIAPPGTAGRALFVVGSAVLGVGLCGLAGSQAVERRAAAMVGYSGPSPVLLFAAWLPTTYVAWVALGLPLELLGLDLAGPPAELLFLVVQTAVAIGLVRLLVVGPGALSWRGIGFSRSARAAGADLAWGALLAGPAILLTAVVGAALIALTGVAPESPLPPTGTSAGLALHLIAGAFVAPIAEEIVFRGVAVTAWTPSVGPAGAILRSSALFAAAHVLFVSGDTFATGLAIAAVGSVGRLPIAAMLGWAFLRRGSIWAPLGLHAAFNAVLIVAAELLVRSTTTLG